MKLFDWALRRNGFPIDEAVLHFKKVMALSADEIIDYQENRKKEILSYHREKNPFYSAFLEKNGIHGDVEWQELPIIKKSDMQVPLESRLSEEYSLDSVFKNNTSGSSGVPFFFAKDKFCHALVWASTKERFGWHGIDFNTSWQARFYGIPLGKLKYYKEKLKDFLSHRVRFSVFNLEDKVCANYLEKFRRTPFEYLNGYTNSLVLFARFCIAKNVVLKNICPTLKVCVTTSEVCTDIDRELLERGFGIKVVNEYGASEMDLIAFEDADGDWLLNEENLFIEIIDDNGLPAPDGTPGRIIITSLYNKALPFIRYEIGDLGGIVPNIRKGHSRILKELTGRTNDLAILPSGRKVPGFTFYYVSKGLLEKGGKLKELIIKQVSSTGFELEYVADEELSDKEKIAVQHVLDTYLEPGLTVSFLKSSHLQRTRAGKLKNFQSMMVNSVI
jgi:phenylacetate-CoA ligase